MERAVTLLKHGRQGLINKLQQAENGEVPLSRLASRILLEFNKKDGARKNVRIIGNPIHMKN